MPDYRTYLLISFVLIVLAAACGEPSQEAPGDSTVQPVVETDDGPESQPAVPLATPTPPTTPTPESQSRRASTSAASCVERYSTETLRNRAFAFDGTVESLETRVDPKLPTEGSQSQELTWATFKVNQWFKGGESPGVEIWVDPHFSEGVWPLEPGDRLLVAGEYRWGQPPQDPIAWGCGFTQQHTPEAAAQWADPLPDVVKLPERDPTASPTPATRSVQADDVREAVFRYLFDHNGCNCPGIVEVLFLSLGTSVGTDRDPTAEFMRRFEGDEPPVRKVSESVWDVAEGVSDRQTGETGIILRVGHVVWMSDTEIQVRGGYYSNGLSAATSLFQVVLQGGWWEVADVNQISES